MSSVAIPHPRTAGRLRDTELPATALEKTMVFFAGMMMPAISVSPWGASGLGILGRVTPVDLVVCVSILVLLARGRKLRFDGPSLTYLAAIALAFMWGLSAINNSSELMMGVAGFVALTMALAYWVLGASVGRSPELLRALLIGSLVGVLWEGVIVLHDYFLPGSKWFVDRAEQRVRGTFRTSGQLAAYGFSVAGLQLCFGWLFWWKKPWFRMLGGMAVVLSLFFVFAASRRSGMAALAIWLMAYLIMGLRHAPKRVYAWLVVLVAVGAIALMLNMAAFEQSYAGRRIFNAIDLVESGSNFIQLQFDSAMGNFDAWFPLGTGPGLSPLVMAENANVLPGGTIHEIHNGHLAILVELGVLGFLAFYWMIYRAVFRRWNYDFGSATPVVRGVLLTFLFAAMAFAIHNRIHRDRGFMLLLGLACYASPSSWPSGRNVPSARGGSPLPPSVAMRR